MPTEDQTMAVNIMAQPGDAEQNQERNAAQEEELRVVLTQSLSDDTKDPLDFSASGINTTNRNATTCASMENNHSRHIPYKGDESKIKSRKDAFAQKVFGFTFFSNTTYNLLLWMLLLSFVPSVASAIYFGIVPLFDPYESFRHKATWVFFVQPGTFTLLSWLIISMFFATLDEDRPWRPFRSWGYMLIVIYCAEVLVVGTTVAIHDPWSCNGVVGLFISLYGTVLLLYFSDQKKFACNVDLFKSKLSLFTKILSFFFLYIVILSLYVIGFSEVGSILQVVLTISLELLVFIFKKILLAYTDALPLEMSMIFAGLWLENLNDMFQTLAYPSVHSPGIVFVVLWVVKTGGNIAYLLFLTDIWFRFRVWIKAFFKGQKGVPIFEDIDPDDRGHSNIRPGYRRRQTWFFSFKIISQLSSAIFFLVNIPILRFGYNNDFYPFSSGTVNFTTEISVENDGELNSSNFRNAMLYAVSFLFAAFVSGVIGKWLLKKYRRVVYDKIYESIARKSKEGSYNSFLFAILTTNAFMSMTIVQYQQRVYFF
eukprot:Nk52_evm3s1315 gene=Nk52_evmTU3s1315